MAITLSFLAHAVSGSNTRTEYSGDLKRIWNPGGLNFSAHIKSGSNNLIEQRGDLKRIWLSGGLGFTARVLSGANSKTEYSSDLKRIWTPGGLMFQAHVVSGSNNLNEYRSDLFRIVFAVLEQHTKDAFIIRDVIQPVGIPWLSDEVTTAAWCWKLSLADGTVLGFTSRDVDIRLSGITYLASSGFDPSSVDTSNDMSVDNLDLAGMLDSEIIKEDDLRQGKYDYAKIEIFMCNYDNLSDVLFKIRSGYLGKVTYGKNGFSAEVRGLMEAYSQQGGKVCQKTCRATLGDAKCQVNVALHTTTGSVTTLNTDGTFQTTLTNVASYFSYGIITWTSGLNTGVSYEVKESYVANGSIDLFLPTVHAIQAGDTFTISAGCDRNATTCRNKFSNLINFRGELYTPGNQYVASYTSSKANNTVAVGANVQRGDYDWG